MTANASEASRGAMADGPLVTSVAASLGLGSQEECNSKGAQRLHLTPTFGVFGIARRSTPTLPTNSHKYEKAGRGLGHRHIK
eukprot:4154020-Pyramimonas_sp.AAC.1